MEKRVDGDQRPGTRTSVTLRDVARESGVSVTTVSRILNKRQSGVPIREDTKRRVEDAASRLGYRPNLLARSLRGQRSTLIGVIACDISDPFHIQILKGINSRALARGYRLFLGDVDNRSEEALAHGSMLERSHADGIIVMGDIQGGEAAIAEISAHHRHLVGVTDRSGRRPYPGVYTDSVTGTNLALEHLWKLGHHSIICFSDTRTADGRQRIETYERFMRHHGAAANIDVRETDQEIGLAFESGLRLFEGGLSGMDYSAAFATSDRSAIGLLQAAYQAGIAVPGHLSIIGFGDIDIAPYTVPPLTTVHQGGVEMGEAAVDLLLHMIEDDATREALDDVVMAPTLAVRHSTASPRDTGGTP